MSRITLPVCCYHGYTDCSSLFWTCSAVAGGQRNWRDYVINNKVKTDLLGLFKSYPCVFVQERKMNSFSHGKTLHNNSSKIWNVFALQK